MSDRLADIAAAKPSALTAEAAAFGIDLSPALADGAALLLNDMLSELKPLDAALQADAPTSDVVGQLPFDNPHGGWAWQGRIPPTGSGLLDGRTVAIKDSIPVAHMPMRVGSEAFHYVPHTHSEPVTRVLASGATITGKAQCEAFCQAGQSGTSWPRGVTHPDDPTRSAGGSSSGSAALVAAGEVDMALGGDSAGSIRVPAAYCGIVGLKPTHGAVPWSSASSLEPTLEHIGPMARTVQDCATLAAVLMDRPDLHGSAGATNGAVCVGRVAAGFDRDGSDPAVNACVDQSLAALEAQGARLERRDGAWLEAAEGLHLLIYLIGMSRLFEMGGAAFGRDQAYPVDQLSALHEAMHGGNLPDALQVCLSAGRFIDRQTDRQTYARAQGAGRQMREAVDGALDGVDCLALPTGLTTAPSLPGPDSGRIERLVWELSAASNAPAFNLTGHPALTVPCGRVNGLPVGIMLVGRWGAESTLLAIGARIERLTHTK